MLTEPDGEIPAQARLPKRLWGSSYKAVAVGSTPTSRTRFLQVISVFQHNSLDKRKRFLNNGVAVIMEMEIRVLPRPLQSCVVHNMTQNFKRINI